MQITMPKWVANKHWLPNQALQNNFTNPRRQGRPQSDGQTKSTRFWHDGTESQKPGREPTRMEDDFSSESKGTKHHVFCTRPRGHNVLLGAIISMLFSSLQ